jgi:hypothetical protein
MMSPLFGGDAGSAVPSNPRIDVIDIESALSHSKQAPPSRRCRRDREGVTLILDQRATVWIDPAANLTDKLIAEMK